jgi:hypothetical protein
VRDTLGEGGNIIRNNGEQENHHDAYVGGGENKWCFGGGACLFKEISNEKVHVVLIIGAGRETWARGAPKYN